MNKKKVPLMVVMIILAALSAFALRRTIGERRAYETAAEVHALAGSWNDWAGTEFRFDGGNWESWFMGNFGSRGTYTTSNGTIVMELAEIHISDYWESYSQEAQTGTYSISGDILALTFGDETRTFTRQ